MMRGDENVGITRWLRGGKDGVEVLDAALVGEEGRVERMNRRSSADVVAAVHILVK